MMPVPLDITIPQIPPSSPARAVQTQASDPPPVVVLEDIEVLARRGAARIRPERTYDAAAIGDLAVYDIAEAVERISGQIGDREPPVILINGRKVADATLFTGFPPDALVRLDVLPQNAAALYGEAPGRRVMNLVLQRRFHSVAIQAGTGRPMAGGTSRVQADARRSVLADQAATILGVQGNGSTALTVGERRYFRSGLPIDDRVTLRPETRVVSANGGGSRSLGEWSTSFRADVRSVDSRSRVPIGGGVVATRDLSHSLTGRLGLSGDMIGWSTLTALDLGLTVSERTGLSEGRSRVRSTGLDLAGTRSLIRLPTGDVMASLSANSDVSWSVIEGQPNAPAAGDNDRSTASARLGGGLVVPLSSHAEGRIGDASLGLGVNLARGDVGGGEGFSTELSWTPIDTWRMSAALTTQTTAPSTQQLYGPLTYGQSSTVFDFATGEAVSIVPITGGNPDLRAPRSEQVIVTTTIGPFTPYDLTIGGTYLRNRSTNGIERLTTHAPALETTFPERFIRDADGRLSIIDQRPFNTASSLSEEVSINLSASVPMPEGRDGEQQRITLSANVTHGLRDLSRLAPDTPVIDRLSGAGGGRARQTVQLDLTTGRGRWNLGLSGRWTGAYRLRSGEREGAGDLAVDDLGVIDLRLGFLLPAKAQRPDSPPYANGGQLILEVENLLDARPSARLADGRPAPGYGRDDRDPIGRSVTLKLSRRF